MPKDLVINIAGDGDLVVETFDLQLTTSDAQYLEQKLWIKFKTYAKELWLNTTKGIPYEESVLVKSPDLVYISTLFKQQILEEPLIDFLISFNITAFDSLTRNISFSWKAQMISGIVIGGTL